MFNTTNNHYHNYGVDNKLNLILKNQQIIIMGQKELQAQLEQQASDLAAIKLQQEQTKVKIQALLDAVKNQPNVTPELQAAADAVTAGIADVKQEEADLDAEATPQP